jgi:glutamate synthase domain-containing protein 1/glutamate synthase domain-containing protein 3
MLADKLIASRAKMIASAQAVTDEALLRAGGDAGEGGCGVVGFAATVPVRGHHIFEPSSQMRNRGNGKGGGIAAAGLIPEQVGVDARMLREQYIYQVALLDNRAENEVEQTCIVPFLEVSHKSRVFPVADYRDLGLEVRPPDIVRYFVRVKPDVLRRFAGQRSLADMPARMLEDEFIFQNSFLLNDRFYASLGEKRAFVVSHARNLVIFKIVGFAEDVVRYYGLEDMCAKVWIAHQRYPTKGRVWHPGGAHPFIGMNEALVHNGDFANYFSVSEYLRQHNLRPQFLTDTEVAVLLFDLWSRAYRYPLEYVIEAMAPTTELDFDRLPAEKKPIYKAIQSLYVHSSPDGPWFFIIARSEADNNRFQLLGITDTSMLRPQVFAIQEGDVSIGLIASEKQAIDATLVSLAQEDKRFRHVAVRYWNARGGSHTDGGAFSFTVSGEADGPYRLACADKFGRPIVAPQGEYKFPDAAAAPEGSGDLAGVLESGFAEGSAAGVLPHVTRVITRWGLAQVAWLLGEVERLAGRSDKNRTTALEFLTLLNNRRYDCGGMRRSAVLHMVRETITKLLDGVAALGNGSTGRLARITLGTIGDLRAPKEGEEILVVDAHGFPPEGLDNDARLAVKAHRLGWRRFIVYGLKGQRFHGCGLGPESDGVRFDVYDSSGDYLASGIDGLEIHVHGNGQDQLGQIMKRGKLVVHGDVGQAFMYGAKGGEVYILGNTAGRPLINAAGRPRVVINGTSLDFLAESFMAGDPLNGGGFVILNGIGFDDQGRVRELDLPYPGSNLFSLASGGAIYVRDPHGRLDEEQLNGGEFSELSDADWKLIRPYLENNERHFGISIERDLLTVNGKRLAGSQVYRKVRAVSLKVLAKATA